MNNNHSHQTRKEETKCALGFEPCWDRPPKSPAYGKHGFSQKPHGTHARDGFNYGL